MTELTMSMEDVPSITLGVGEWAVGVTSTNTEDGILGIITFHAVSQHDNDQGDDIDVNDLINPNHPDFILALTNIEAVSAMIDNLSIIRLSMINEEPIT